MSLRPHHVAPELINKVTKTLGITALDQWYYVSQHAASKAIGVHVLKQFGGTLQGFLQAAYPQHHFDERKIATKKNQEKDQKFLEVIIRKLFPNTEIHTKARKAVGIVNPETDAYLEIDFWIPSLKLGIEYQDKHHYGYQWYANAALDDYQQRDSIKKATMPTLGYTLINIGFWWDKTLESVAATIRKFRPDLLQEHENGLGEPIPQEPPPGIIEETPVIPGVAGLMSPFIPTSSFDPTNWYAGEKHDGIRGVYNPKLNKMFSRSGKELSVIDSLLNDIPDILADGEIVAGRGNYNRTAAVSYHTHHAKVIWPMFRYVLYDIPDSESGNYTQRYAAIVRELMAFPFAFAQSAFRVLVANKSHLKRLVDAIISDAGEGVIVQQDAVYEYGRAHSLAKIKLRRDADAQVLSIDKLSCNCELTSGGTADIFFYDDFNPSELKVGDIVSYYHNGYLQSGKPKRGEIYKIRYDITWDVINDKTQNISSRSVKDATGSGSLISRVQERKQLGHWNKSTNIRAFFDEFARTAGFDPLVAENWYPVKISTLQNAGGSYLHRAYNYDLKKALSSAYPELSFDEEKLRPRARNGYWNKLSNVRAFLDEFASTSGFDPLLAENWAPVTGRILQNAGGGGLLYAYRFNRKKALSSAYPELKFAKLRTKARKGHWNKAHNVREFFDEFAQSSRFDPLVAENWHPINGSTLQKAGGGSLLYAYSFNLPKALSFAYPELKFDNFRNRATNGYWTKASNVRAFFDEFAKTSGFDPRSPENWYSVRFSTLRIAAGSGLLSAYHFNLKKALEFAYPELKFEAEKFKHKP